MALDIIAKLRTHSELTKWFLEHKIELTNYFGDLYNAEKTDFTLIAPIAAASFFDEG